MWNEQPHTMALMDVRVIDSDAPLHTDHPVVVVLSTAEQEKKWKYSAAVEAHRASFTPYVQTIDGVLSHEVQVFLKCPANQLSSCWDQSYARVMHMGSNQDVVCNCLYNQSLSEGITVQEE